LVAVVLFCGCWAYEALEMRSNTASELNIFFIEIIYLLSA